MLLVLDAQAAEPTGTLTLTCKGTEEIRGAADTTSIRVIIDFQNRTVTLGDDLLNIYSLNEATISFRARITSGPFVRSVDGTIDRMTGEARCGFDHDRPEDAGNNFIGFVGPEMQANDVLAAQAPKARLLTTCAVS